APNHSELEAYADRLNLPKMDVNHRGVTTLNDSGYIRIAKGEAVAFLDLAPIGPDYLPGHAHADTLSFELSLFGKRIFVNSGTSDYGNEVIRNYERSTAAHNTLELDGKNSSDVWGAFRVGRRAKVIKKEIIETESEIRISGSHNGYHHLQGNPLHERHWLLTSNKLIIHDIVKGVGGHNITNRLHVHPDYHIEKENHNIINIKSFNKDIVCSVYMNGGEIIFEESYYSYGFNLREKKIVICLINSLVNLSAEFLIEIYFNKK
ncbi:heparinase, partial [Candidatus Poribacteria bacterium]|nr:heparinase [Candidatus Poribacteria bacterium]